MKKIGNSFQSEICLKKRKKKLKLVKCPKRWSVFSAVLCSDIKVEIKIDIEIKIIISSSSGIGRLRFGRDVVHSDAAVGELFEAHLRGPGFLMEPPGRVEFSNSSGGWLAGELLIHNLQESDESQSFRCRSMHRLTRQVVVSSPTRLRINSHRGIISPSVVEHTAHVQVSQDEGVVLLCVAQGCLSPEYRFMIGQYITVHGDVISHVNISHVMVEDGGEYSCRAENRAGQVQHAARLNIYGLPYIRLIPKVTAVSGETLNLKCPVAGYPIEEIHWERGGREFPDDIRQRVQPDGSLSISPVQKNSDSGVYTCWARNKQGHSARRSGEVTVIVPPKLSPFQTTILQLNMGDRASLTCSVVKGDLPLTIAWRKDGRPIDTTQHMSVKQVDQYNSILVIENLRSDHTGNYSCAVRNSAAEVENSQALLVNVPWAG